MSKPGEGVTDSPQNRRLQQIRRMVRDRSGSPRAWSLRGTPQVRSPHCHPLMTRAGSVSASQTCSAGAFMTIVDVESYPLMDVSPPAAVRPPPRRPEPTTSPGTARRRPAGDPRLRVTARRWRAVIDLLAAAGWCVTTATPTADAATSWQSPEPAGPPGGRRARRSKRRAPRSGVSGPNGPANANTRSGRSRSRSTCP